MKRSMMLVMTTGASMGALAAVSPVATAQDAAPPLAAPPLPSMPAPPPAYVFGEALYTLPAEVLMGVVGGAS